MRRVVLLAILALALPTAALADSFSFTGELPGSLTGDFSSGLNVTMTLTSVDINGTVSAATGSIMISTGALTAGTCPMGFSGSCFSFTAGNVTVSGGATFSDSFSGFVNDNNGSLEIVGTLTPNGVVSSGLGSVTATFQTNGEGFTLTSGSTDIAFNTVPEPGTLSLLGTGLIGLAGVVRRKLRA